MKRNRLAKVYEIEMTFRNKAESSSSRNTKFQIKCGTKDSRNIKLVFTIELEPLLLSSPIEFQ